MPPSSSPPPPPPPPLNSKMKLFKTVALLCYIQLLLPAYTSSSPCHFPAIVNFGDSNSDTGGLSAAFGPFGRPSGETFFHMPVGRASDGRLLIDFIAKKVKLPFVSAYLDSLGSNFSSGVNFATSASTILPTNATFSNGGYSPFSLDVQLRQFWQFRSRSQLLYKRGGVFKGLMPKLEYFSQALFTTDIGQNDLTQLYFGNQSAHDYLANALNQFASLVEALYKQGGRSFWIHNTGPLGCLPYALLRAPSSNPKLDSAGCAVEFNELAQKFNMMLNDSVSQLRKELPLAALIYVDVYSAKYSLFTNPQKFGFENPLRTCCGYGGGKYNFDFNLRCGDSRLIGGKWVLLGKSCREPRKSVIWDGIHYTDAANKQVFNLIATGKYSHPPVPLTMACQAL